MLLMLFLCRAQLCSTRFLSLCPCVVDSPHACECLRPTHTAVQGHVFEEWPAAGSRDEDKQRLLDQAISLDAKYPGGLKAYVTKVRRTHEFCVVDILNLPVAKLIIS